MTLSVEQQARLTDLIDAVCNATITPEQTAHLEDTLSHNPDAQWFYLQYIHLHGTLLWDRQSHSEWDALRQMKEQGLTASPTVGSTEQPITPCESMPSPLPPSILGNVWHGTIGYFSHEMPFSLLMGAALTGLLILVAWLVPVSRPVEIAKRSSRTPSVVKPRVELVGKITGMVDVKWVNDNSASFNDARVSLGRKYELVLGLMEITYDTGAKVILQGPVTYEVESKNGGFLPVGKLTGKVEDETAKGFTVRTPAATVTDLGTEFGVEVSKEGHTTSHVFRGSVKLQKVSAKGEPEGVAQVLRENQSARVEKSNGSQSNGNPVIVVAAAPKSVDFVRKMPQLSLKKLDLVDVVAGGNGFSRKRDRGIDPTTGRISDIQSGELYVINGDYKYHRVEGIPFVDGVFIPDGSKGPVQIDSAGHVFPDCPETDNCSWVNVWAGGKVPQRLAVRMAKDLEGIDYFSPEHGALLMHANKGLTFDLDAIRRDNPGHRVLRFRAVTGNMEPESEKNDNVSADIWVLVDGQVRFKRRDISHFLGAMPVEIAIGNKDRFLTLAATDGGNTVRCDQIIFGDPRLELLGPAAPAHDTK